MPKVTFHIGGPNSIARRAQLLDELYIQVPLLIEKAKDEKSYVVDTVRNNYIDGVIDQLNDILEYIRINID